MQLVAVLFQLQSLQQFGGVSGTHLDWTMVPYVRMSFRKHYLDGLTFIAGITNLPDIAKDLSIEDDFYKVNTAVYNYALTLTTRELNQAVEGMYHNLNSLQSRSGAQLPFSSINYGTCTLPEGRMVIRALLEGSINGVGKLHMTSIFPCGIFQMKTGVNRFPGDPNYDLFQLATQSTSKRLYPNYANCDWGSQVAWENYDIKLRQSIVDSLSEEDRTKLFDRLKEVPSLSVSLGLDENLNAVRIDDPKILFSTMGCRTANGADCNFDDIYKTNIRSVIETGKLRFPNAISAAQKDGRGNICPVTIILPTLAMEADRDVECFMTLLDTKISEAKDMLLERFKFICAQEADAAKFMYENDLMVGYKPEDGVVSAMKHGTLAIGQIGLAETLELLIGCNQTTEKGMELAKRIENLYKTRCAEFKEKYKLNFGVYYTPAESLCMTSLRKFRDKYGVIPKVSDREWQDISIFDKIDVESQLTGYSSAGCITYVELDSSVQGNPKAIEDIVNYAMDKDIPYFAINIPNDSCLECGYTDEFNDSCPICGSKHIRQLRRVTGYLTGNYLTAFNDGKIAEVKDRVKHKYTGDC